LKDQLMKKVSLLALAGLFASAHVQAISLDDIQIWTGSGTNRAALVIEWNSPAVFNSTTVPAPVATKTMVWGYRFNGAATGTQMLEAIAAADPKLYVVADTDYGSTFVDGIGYNLTGRGLAGVTDGTDTDYFTNGFSWNGPATVDATAPVNPGDLYWAGSDGPNWQIWTELGDAGGFTNSPEGGNSVAVFTVVGYEWIWTQGQWTSAENSLDGLSLTNGSWIGFSVAAAGLDYFDASDPANNYYYYDEQAPPSPAGTYVAYLCNTNDFAVQVVSSNDLATTATLNDPTAILGRPTLEFIEGVDTNQTSLIDSPYNVAPNGSNVIAKILGNVVVDLGRKVYDDPYNPYGVDFIVYGNSFLTANGADLNSAIVYSYEGSDLYGHATSVAVSQDGTNWYTYANTPKPFPDNAFLWDNANDAWTSEQLNPTKPLNPFIYTNNFVGQPASSCLDLFGGAAGGTGYDLKESGLPWIQYVRLAPSAGTGNYAVIDAVAAVNPVAVGDTLYLSPDNLAGGVTNLAFQNPGNLSQNQISINFDFLSEAARISTVSLSEFSSFAPLEGTLSSAYQVQVRPAVGADSISLLADLQLRVSSSYAGNGKDLRVFQWVGTNWSALPFSYNATNQQVAINGVTTLSAFAVAQIVPPSLSLQSTTNGVTLQIKPVPNCPGILERSTNLVTWMPIGSFAATNALSLTLVDTNAVAAKAFYRVQANP
jgi:hypothetical protein